MMHQKDTSPKASHAAAASGNSSSSTWSAIVKKSQGESQQQEKPRRNEGTSTPPAQQLRTGGSATNSRVAGNEPRGAQRKKPEVSALKTEELSQPERQEKRSSSSLTPSKKKQLRSDAKEFSPSKERVEQLKRESWADSPVPAGGEEEEGKPTGGGSASRLRSDAAEFTPSKSPQKGSASASPDQENNRRSPKAKNNNSANNRSPAANDGSKKGHSSQPSSRATTPSKKEKAEGKEKNVGGIMGRGDEKWEKGAEDLRNLLHEKRDGFEKERQARPNLVPTALRKLMVAQLPMYFTDDDLRQMFQPYGALSHVKVIYHHEKTNQSRGFGFVEYYSSYAAMMAKEGLNGFQVEFNKKLQIKYADEVGASVANPQIVHRPRQVLEALAFQQEQQEWLGFLPSKGGGGEGETDVAAENKEGEGAGEEEKKPYSSFGSPTSSAKPTFPKPQVSPTRNQRSRGGRTPYQHSPYGSNVLSPPSPEKKKQPHREEGGGISPSSPDQFSVTAKEEEIEHQEQYHQEAESGYPTHHSSSYYGESHHQYYYYPPGSDGYYSNQQGYQGPPEGNYSSRYYASTTTTGGDVGQHPATTWDSSTGAPYAEDTETGPTSSTAATSTLRKRRGKRGGARKQKRIQEIQESQKE